MKKSAIKNQITKCVGILILMLITNSLFAQKNVVKLTPLKPAFGKTSLTYERALKGNSSLSVECQFWNLTKTNDAQNTLGFLTFPLLSVLSNTSTTYKNKGSRFQLEYRKYFSKNTKPGDGFYFTGAVFTGQHTTTQTSRDYGLLALFSDSSKKEIESSSVNSSGAKAGVGIQKKWGAFVLDCNTRLGGASINKSSKINHPATMNGLFLESNLAIGITF